VLTTVLAGSCTINANQPGNSAYSAAPQVSQTFSIAAVAPAAATNVSATAGNGQATVSFTAPSFTGGEPITGYTVTSNPGGLTATGTVSSITVTGLTNGTSYTFTVTATNSAGTGLASAPSNAVIPLLPTLTLMPATLPNPVQGSEYNASLTASGGTGPYTFAVTSGQLPPKLTLSSGGIFSGKTNGKGTYTFTIRATDSSPSPGPYFGTRTYSVTVSSKKK